MSSLTGCGIAEKMPLTVPCQQGLPFFLRRLPELPVLYFCFKPGKK